MKPRWARSASLFLLLVLLWMSRWSTAYAGGIGNYHRTTWGLYEWAESRRLQAAFAYVQPGRAPVEQTRSINTLGWRLTVVATIGLLGFGGVWVGWTQTPLCNQRWWGLLTWGTVAIIWAVYIWWPEIRGVTSRAGDCWFSRGLYDYVVECVQIRGSYLPPEYPADELVVGRSFAVNWVGAAFSLVASVVGLIAAYWASRLVTRVGLAPD